MRGLVALSYKWNTYQCNICQQNLSKFVTLKNGQTLCLNCGCLPRTRRLFAEIETLENLASKSILHFSPPNSLRNKISTIALKSYTITSKEERLKHFGQDDHVRIYSVKGLTDRLEKAGFLVEIDKLEQDTPHKNGFMNDGIMLKAKKKI